MHSRKVEPMESFHKALCGHIIVGNRMNGVEDVAMKKTLKGVVDKWFVWTIHTTCNKNNALERGK